MRFYDPSTDPPTRVESGEAHPGLRENESIKQCVLRGFLPSVTTVLKEIRDEFLERWWVKEGIREYEENGKDAGAAVEKIFTRTLPSASFGTDCHAVVEEWSGGPKAEVTDEVRLHTAPFLQWLEANVQECLFSERLIADQKLKVAGTADLGILLKDGRRIVGDLKVVKYSKKYPPTPGVKYSAQLSAYAEMLRNQDDAHYDRMNFFLASPFGYDKAPHLQVFEHSKCHLAVFSAARTIWEFKYGA